MNLSKPIKPLEAKQIVNQIQLENNFWSCGFKMINHLATSIWKLEMSITLKIGIQMRQTQLIWVALNNTFQKKLILHQGELPRENGIHFGKWPESTLVIY